MFISAYLKALGTGTYLHKPVRHHRLQYHSVYLSLSTQTLAVLRGQEDDESPDRNIRRRTQVALQGCVSVLTLSVRMLLRSWLTRS